jgi:adenylate cyclase class IV
MTNLSKHTEFESKYRIKPHKLIDFKRILDAIPEQKRFIFVEGTDKYYISPELKNGFARYRKPHYGLDNGRSEVTIKTKPIGAKNNIKRKELNWRVDLTDESAIDEGLRTMGFTFNFSIYKACHIYQLNDATVVFYTVYDSTNNKITKADSFVEIEVKEETISEHSEDSAMKIIEKYESFLKPLGLTARNRLKQSLFEMYKR